MKIRVPNTVNHMDGIDLRGGVLEKTMVVDGTERRFIYYIPKTLKKGAGIIFMAHGSHCNGRIMRKATAYAFEEAAERENYIIAYPDSFGPYWNDGRLGRVHPAREAKIDEEKFFRRMIHYFRSVYDSSEKEVFFGGFSNGGALGFKFAQDKIFKGVALWCINLPSPENRDYEITGETPVLLINNLEDRMVPFEGGDLIGGDGKSRGRFDSAYESFLKVSKKKTLPPWSLEDEGVKRYEAGGNILLEVERGGHVIPHPDTVWPVNLGEGSPFDSVAYVLRFFEDIKGA